MAFITFEGIDGSGKSTLLKGLAAHLKGLGLRVEVTREPGGSTLGQELREILLRPGPDAPGPEAELLIYEADRAQHVRTKIRPWLEAGAWVLSDRFYDSSMAFQGAGRKLDREAIRWLNDFATSGLNPTATVLLDCDVKVSAARRRKRETDQKSQADRFEQEKTAFHTAVRHEFLKLASEEPTRFITLDATLSPEELLNTLLAALSKRNILK